MKKQKAAWILVLASLVCVPAVRAQDSPQSTQTGDKAGTSPTSDENMQAYIELLRSDVRQQKAEMLGEVMQLSAADAAKFWPIYSEYDAKLTKLNDLRVANIQEYSSTYDEMTDAATTQLTYLSTDAGVDAEKANDIVRHVSELRARGLFIEISFPMKGPGR